MADPQNPLKTTGLALNGQLITVDQIPANPTPFPAQGQVTISSEYANYQPSPDVDYTDLSSVNRELQNLRIRLHRLRIELKNADRQALKTRYAYEARKKRTLISLSGGSAGEREAMAELLAESEYTEMLIASAVAKEITNHNRDIRTELETLREISNNLRRQIDLQ
jgi:ethanolamine utilization protein EutA (predicted chaperonin)